MTGRSNAAKLIGILLLPGAILFSAAGCAESDWLANMPSAEIVDADIGEAYSAEGQVDRISASNPRPKPDKESLQSVRERIEHRLLQIIGEPRSGYETDVDLLDPFAAFFASELAQQCGEFLAAPEQLWAKSIMIKVGIGVTAETFKGYLRSLRPEIDSIFDMAVNMYGPYVSLAIFRKLTESGAQSIAASGCAGPGVRAVSSELHAYIKWRLRDTMEGFGDSRFAASEEIPCPRLEIRCIEAVAKSKMSELLTNEQTFFERRVSDVQRPTSLGNGVLPWLKFLGTRGVEIDTLGEIPWRNSRNVESVAWRAMACYTMDAKKYCGFIASYLELPYDFVSHVLPYLLAFNDVEKAEQVLSRLNPRQEKYHLGHLARAYTRAGNMNKAMFTLLAWARSYVNEINRSLSDSPWSVSSKLDDIWVLRVAVADFAARFDSDMRWLTSYLEKNLADSARALNMIEPLAWVRLAGAIGRADVADARDIEVDLEQGAFFQPDDGDGERRIQRELVLTRLAILYASAGDRDSFDRAIDGLPEIRHFTARRVEALTHGARHFGDRKLLAEARRITQEMPARMSIAISHALEFIALAEVAQGNLAEGWRMASRIKHSDVRLRVQYQIFQPITGVSAPYH